MEGFASEVLGRAVTDKEAKEALAEIASEMGMDATDLDARIWDYMQLRSKKKRRRDQACKKAITAAADHPGNKVRRIGRSNRESVLVGTDSR